jgi:parallel beta helix pectate lyase-like protein
MKRFLISSSYPWVPALALLGFCGPLAAQSDAPSRLRVFVAPSSTLADARVAEGDVAKKGVAQGEATDENKVATADGSLLHPFTDLAAARDWLRPRRVKGQLAIITLLPGRHTLSQTVTFDHRDEQLLIRDQGEATLTGSVRILQPELQRVADAELAARLPAMARPHVRSLSLPDGYLYTGPVQRGMGTPVVPVGTEVIVDGEFLTRARWPNDGFHKVAEVVDVGSIPRNRADDVAPDKRETGPLRGGVFRPVDRERLQRWAQAPDAWAFGYWHWDWADELLPIESVDVEAGTIKLAQPHRYGLRKGTEFYVTNLLEELDRPGEYWIDPQAKILYFWPPTEMIQEIVLTTMAEPLLAFEKCDNIRVEGLQIRATRGAAILAREVTRLRIQYCEISQIGTTGIDLEGEYNLIKYCDFQAIGATAVRVSGGDRQTLELARNRVAFNNISDFGRVYRTYQPAVSIRGVGQVVINNQIHDAPHAAIIFGGNDHQILRNEIYDVLNETGDCGAIYCGRDWAMGGNVIQHNFIHDLQGTSNRYQNAIYLDDMASGIEVSENLIVNCNWGMLIGGGRDLDIRGNVFVSCELGVSFDARGVGWMAKNIQDPSTSTLHRNLSKFDLHSPPWSTRFPELQSYLTNDFGRPVGSKLINNQFFDTPLGRVDDKKNVVVADNQLRKGTPDWLIHPTSNPDDYRFKLASYADIPLLQIGLHANPRGH